MKKIFALVITVLLILINGFTFEVESTATSEKKWVYYINSNDSNRLYKMLSDGSDITKLSDYIVSQAIVFNNRIYFTVSETDAPPGSYYGLFRIKTDGSLEEGLIENVLHGNITDIDDIYQWNDYVCIPCKYKMIIYKNNKFCRTVTLFEYVENDNYDDLETDHWSSLDWEKYYANPKNGYFSGYYFNGFKNGYVYMTSCKDGSHRKIKIDNLANLNGKLIDTDSSVELIEVKKLPEKFDSKKNLPFLSTDYYREKKLAWSKVDGCDKYQISKYDENQRAFSVIFETVETSAIISVLNSEYNLEYKVTAVKKSNEKENYTDVPLIEYHAKEYCTGNSGGVSAEYGELYIVCLSDGIYSVNKDGEKVTKISSDTAESVCYADGTIYYITAPDSNSRKILYSITTDGKSKKELYRTSYEISSFTVTNKSIYFNEFNDDWGSSSIIKIDRVSGKISTIVGGGVNDPIISGMCFYDDKIFYSCNISPENIISANPDGTEKRIITQKGNKQMFRHGGKLYFLSGGLCSVNTDGSKFKRLADGDAFAGANGFQINNGSLYFVKKGSIYSSDINGINIKKIFNSKNYFVDSFSAYDNGIIFISNKKMYFFDISNFDINELGSTV